MALKPFNSDDGYSVGLEGTNVIDATGNFTATGSITRNNRNVPVFVYQANTPPANALVGDQWFDTNSGVLFEYLNDGTSSQWVDTNGLPGVIVNTENLTVSGNATFQGNAIFGNANTVFIYGGSDGQFLQTDGNGNLTWATGGSGNGAPIAISNQGNLLTPNVTSMNFTGPGVVANADGSNVTITISGGGGGSGDSISNGTSNLSIATANGNIVAGVNGTTNVMTITSNGVTASNITGNIYDGNQRIIDIGASMPYVVDLGQTITIPNNKQGIYTLPITIDGTLEVDGILVQVDGTPTYGNQIINGNSNVVVNANSNVTVSVAGNANIVTVTGTGANIAGTLNVTGNTILGLIGDNLIPTQNVTYSLGNTTNRWNNLYLSGNTIVLGDSTISAANGNVLLPNTIFVGNVAIAATPNNTITFSGAEFDGNIEASNANLGNSVTANFFVGDGGYLTNVGGVSSNAITDGNSNVMVSANGNVTTSVAGNANILVVTGTGANINGYANIFGNLITLNANLGNVASANFLTGTLTTAAQPNITSVGNLSSLTITGNITASNLGNISSLNLDGNVSNVLRGDGSWAADQTNYSNANVANYLPTYTGNLTAGNANLGNAVSANYFIGDGGLLTNISTASGTSISNGNSNVIVEANSNVTTSVAGNANVFVVTGTGANVNGYLTTSGNLSAGNVSGGNLVTATYISGTLTTASQPNITSVGTLSSLTVTGNSSAGNLSVSGDALISGNLTVNGNVTYINVETLSVEDPIINLGTGPNGAAPTSNTGKDVGSALNYFDTEARIAFLGWDVSSTEFVAASTATIANDVVTVTSLGNLRANFFLGDGSQLTNLPTPVLSSISNGTSNVTVSANSNITLSVNNVANVLTITGSNVVANANILAGNTVSANYFLGDGGLLSNINVAGGDSIINGNSNVVVAANGNVTTSVSGNANVLVVTGNAIVTTGIKTDNYMYANGAPFSGGGGGNAQPQIFNVYQGGALFVYTGSTRWYAAYNLNVNSVKSRLVTPADGNVTIEVMKNGNISVLTQTIPPGNTTVAAYTTGIALSEDDYLTVNVTDVGSNAAPGYDLYVQFQFLKT